MNTKRSPQASQLKNGLHIVHYETTSHVAYAGIMIGSGSRDELQHEQGLAHLVEHMLFKGTTKRKAFHIANRVESIGGELNAYTAKEETALHAVFIPTYLNRILELLADVICNASFPQHELEREREVILEEIASYRDAPAELIYDEFENLIYSGNSLGRSILGTPRSVKGFTRESILAYIERNYTTERLALCTAGPFPFKRVEALAEKLLSDLPHAKAQRTRPTLQIAPPTATALKRHTAQAHCVVGTTGLPLDDPKSATLALLSNILGGYASTSLLNRNLREIEGLAYSVESNVVSYTDTGLFTIYFGTDKKQVNRSFDIVLKELKKLREKPLSTMKLHLAKRQFIGQLYLGAENLESIMLSGGRRTIENLPLLTLQEAQKEIQEITAQQIQEVANELLRPEQLSTLLYH